MPNPHPKLENLKPFKPKHGEPMTGRLFTRVPASIETVVKTLPTSERSEWLRRVITDAAKRELMNDVSVPGLDAPIPHRGGGTNETPPIELSPILKELETAFLSGKTLKPTDIKQLWERLRSLNLS